MNWCRISSINGIKRVASLSFELILVIVTAFGFCVSLCCGEATVDLADSKLCFHDL